MFLLKTYTFISAVMVQVIYNLDDVKFMTLKLAHTYGTACHV
jgi:hypothetical protein